jgi:hypothetical protein
MSVLLQKVAIEQVPTSSLGPGFYSRLFFVPKKKGGMRKVIDLSILNTYLVAPISKWRPTGPSGLLYSQEFGRHRWIYQMLISIALFLWLSGNTFASCGTTKVFSFELSHSG